jgi:hypothetical protein
MASAFDKLDRKKSYIAQARERFDICRTCPAFDNALRLAEVCTDCGCMARLKVLHPGEKCPRGRW